MDKVKIAKWLTIIIAVSALVGGISKYILDNLDSIPLF